MKPLAVTIALLLAALAATAQTPAPDPVLQAMRDELARSRSLTLPGLEKPYFIQYLVRDWDAFRVTASAGGLVEREREKDRSGSWDVRVGDYKFDNTNYTGSGYSYNSGYGQASMPLEDNYPVLRRYLWLNTDRSYKSAVEAISRKRAALRNLTVTEQINDFAHADPVHYVKEIPRLALDEEAWTRRARDLSAIFLRYPEVTASSVVFYAYKIGRRIVNSEGTEVRHPLLESYVRVQATTHAADGWKLTDSVEFFAPDPANLAPEAELRRGIAALAENAIAAAHAPKGEDYNGPVLFEAVAGRQLLAELLSRNLPLSRSPVQDRGSNSWPDLNELEGRMGARVLPEFMDVVDDPARTEWHGRPLFGYYDVDREGVVPKPLHLVEKGVLKGYLLTRQPVRGFEGSNGRARINGGYGASAPAISNLFVTASQTAPVPELKKKLIALCQARNKPYGIIVRKMDFPSAATIDEVRRLLTNELMTGGFPVTSPVLVYKLFPDGHEEQVRGLRFRGLNMKSLKDILAVGDDSTPFEFLYTQEIFSLIGASTLDAQVSVIAPSILVDDLELHPVKEQMPKLPVVPSPLLRQ